jgi:phage terminase small subunit
MGAPMTERKLTSKQRKFAEVYAGNGTAAARAAGYRGSDNVMAQIARRNLRIPELAQVIRLREVEEFRPAVLSRHERQLFWSQVAMDKTESIAVRLRASELLGKSEGDFVERVEATTTVTLEQLVLASFAPAGDQWPRQ